MPAVFRFLGTHEVLIYILLSIGALFAVRWLWTVWNEWRRSVFSLEREFALRRIGQATASLALLFALFLGEVFTATFIYPNLPAVAFVPTMPPDLRASPTGTISAELATEIALTPPPANSLQPDAGCIPNQVMIGAPRSGQEVRGTIDIQGTVNIPEFGFYKYEISPTGAESWATIAAGRAAVIGGSLGQWDTTSVAPGDYSLRLVVSDNQGRALPACIVTVRVSPQE